MHIVWIKTELLHPVDKGGRIRTYQMLKALARRHHITYVTLDDGQAAPDAAALACEYCTDLVTVPFRPARKRTPLFFADVAGNMFSSLPYVVERYRSRELRDAIERNGAQADLVICDFLTPSINVPDRIAASAVLFQHNVEAMIWERHAAVARNAVLRKYMSVQWQRMRRFEAHECARFGSVIAVSDHDAKIMRQEYGVQSISAVPTGVDTDYFAQSFADATPLLNNLVFVGSMDWMPNDDGIRWFTESVFPGVRRQIPNATLTVVGRAPSPAMQRIASRIPGVEVTGTVPDVRPYLQRAAASVVPLRIGGGTRLKIYEAMAAGTPVVSTTIGAEGLPVHHGEHLLIADGATDQTQALVSLLKQPEDAHGMATRARTYVRKHFGWDAVADHFLLNCAKKE